MHLQLPFGIEKSQAIDALRLAIQSALAAVITYIVMRYFEMPEVFLGILSAVLIVEPSVGNTLNQAQGRILATLVGSAIGFLCVTFLPWGVGTAISLLVVMFVMNGVAGLRPDWRYGVVAALAITLGSESNAIDSSVDRVMAILAGAGIGVLISLVIWPDKAENRTKRYINSALVAASKRFEIAIKNTRKKDNSKSDEIQGNYHKNIDLAQKSSAAIRFAEKEHLIQQIEQTKKLYNSIIIVDRVANHSNKHVSDGSAGIKNDIMEVQDLACKLTKVIASNSEIDTKDIDQLEELTQQLKKNIKSSEESKDLNTLRYTLVFGMLEIKDSIKNLIEASKIKE